MSYKGIPREKTLTDAERYKQEQEALARQAKRDWINHATTQDEIAKLTVSLAKHMEEAIKLSVMCPPDTSRILMHLIQANKTKQILDSYAI